ncbi:hypothetical protein WL07_03630 [Burkholderia cepacia]|nr:hypothetical protein WL07_03630 [Burkholderia cepacia]
MAVLAGAGIVLAIQQFLPAYARKKGENLATKQDIAEITRRQEEIKHQFAEIIEASKQRHALRTLAADKRMEAHQQAFKQVKGLLSAGEDKTIIDGCRGWMDGHCLYLTLEARKAVWQAIGHAEGRALFLAEARDDATDVLHRNEYHERATEKWNAIMGALPAIVTGVELPPLGEDELAVIRATETEDGGPAANRE